MNEIQHRYPDFYSQVRKTLEEARDNAFRQVNTILVKAYWEVGRLIVEEEQGNSSRAAYGEQLIKDLSIRLTMEVGKGNSTSNLKRMRKFFLLYPKGATLSHLLSWSHYCLLITVENKEAIEFYLQEANSATWSVRTLKRQINSLYYERLLMSKEKSPLREEAKEKNQSQTLRPRDIIKDPFILEFLGLEASPSFYESELEAALIKEIQQFLLELGRGFAFIARQKRIHCETRDFYIDLVFYHYLLKCFVLIDLKTGELTHQDIGQMDMYVRMFDQLEKPKEDNPTVGIILCTNKNKTVVKYSVLDENEQLFASQYKLHLPTEQELTTEIESTRALFEQKGEE